MFLGTFWEHHTCLYIYHALIIKYLNTILCYSEEIAKYVPIVVKLCYAIAGVVAVVGAISVYIAMNNWLFWTARNVLKCTDIEQFVKT